jgi:multidrug efflux pump subunit AcrA (membrane-fusion protein)
MSYFSLLGSLAKTLLGRFGRAERLAANLGVVGLVMLGGCGQRTPPPPPPPPKVSVVTVDARAVPITTELPGRVAGYRYADVRPQVNGIILKRLFNRRQVQTQWIWSYLTGQRSSRIISEPKRDY